MHAFLFFLQFDIWKKKILSLNIVMSVSYFMLKMQYMYLKKKLNAKN